jgi:hypothetical protein
MPKKITSKLKKHAKYHTKKHISSMKAAMKKGNSFTSAHKKAMEKVGH